MAFQASKERGRKKEPAVRGRQLIASAAVVEEYSKFLKAIAREMTAEYKEEIGKLMRAEGTRDHYASDAKLPLERFKAMFKRLADKWRKKVEKISYEKAESFFMKVDKHAFTTVGSSLKAMGIHEPKGIKKSFFEEQMALAVQQNVALIKSIPEELHGKIERAVWNSLTSPEGKEQGAYGINAAIMDYMGKEFTRAEFIAEDQTKKIYSVMTNARLEQNGLDRFEWAHSSAGKKPRQCHVKWNGRVFLTRGGPTDLWEVLKSGKVVKVTPGYDGARESDIGKPGHPPRCRCRAIPILDVD